MSRPTAVETYTPLELLAALICESAGARFCGCDQRRGHPTHILFSPDIPGEPPIESLAISELSSRNIRLALQKYRLEEVGA